MSLEEENRHLRILIAAIVRDAGGRLAVSDISIMSISDDDAFDELRSKESNHIVLLYPRGIIP